MVRLKIFLTVKKRCQETHLQDYLTFVPIVEVTEGCSNLNLRLESSSVCLPYIGFLFSCKRCHSSLLHHIHAYISMHTRRNDHDTFSLCYTSAPPGISHHSLTQMRTLATLILTVGKVHFSAASNIVTIGS